MNQSLSIEIEDKVEGNEIVADVLKSYGIGVSFVKKLNLGKDTYGKTDENTLVENLDLIDSSLKILEKHGLVKYSEVLNSFRHGFSDIKRMRDDEKLDISNFIMSDYSISKKNFIPFSALDANVIRVLLFNKIYSIDILKSMSYDSIVSLDGMKPATASDLFVSFAKFSSPTHFEHLFKVKSNKLPSIAKVNPVDMGGLLSVHKRTSVKNLALLEENIAWLVDNGYKTFGSLIVLFEDDFEKIKSLNELTNTRFKNLVSDITNYVVSKSSIKDSSNALIAHAFSRDVKTFLLANKIYDVSFLKVVNIEDYSLLTDKLKLEITKEIDDFQNKKKKKDRKNENKNENKNTEKSNSKVEKQKQVVKEKKESIGLSDSASTLDSKEISPSGDREKKLDPVEIIDTDYVKLLPMHKIECLDLPAKLSNAIKSHGMFFAEELAENDQKMNLVKGLNVTEKTYAHELAVGFLDREDIATFNGYISYHIRDLNLPYNVYLALFESKLIFIDDLAKKSLEDLQKIDKIGKATSALIYDRVNAAIELM
jgi:hypothetical protein